MDANADQKNSTAYRLAVLDPDFLLGNSMRGVRLQLEYEKAEERLRAWVVRSTIVVFGSARVLPRESNRQIDFTASLPSSAVQRPPPSRRGGTKKRCASVGSRQNRAGR